MVIKRKIYDGSSDSYTRSYFMTYYLYLIFLFNFNSITINIYIDGYEYVTSNNGIYS